MVFNIVSIFIIVLCFVVSVGLEEDNDARTRNASSFVISISMSVLLFGYNIDNVSRKYPKALDVYRNKTELQVTCTVVNNDTTEIDSVVVFKTK